jgi:hypothetical protein
MVYDPTINLGNLLVVGTLIFGGAAGLIRHSFTAGKYSEDLHNLHADLSEIKGTLQRQDEAFRAKLEADAEANGVMLVLQQRVLTLENREKVLSERTHRIASLEAGLNLLITEVATLRADFRDHK